MITDARMTSRETFTVVSPRLASKYRALAQKFQRNCCVKVERRTEGLFEIVDVTVVTTNQALFYGVAEDIREIAAWSPWRTMHHEWKNQRWLARKAFKKR